MFIIIIIMLLVCFVRVKCPFYFKFFIDCIQIHLLKVAATCKYDIDKYITTRHFRSDF